MGWFDRIKRVASGAASNVVGELERANPAAVYEAAIEDALARMQEHRDAAARLAAQRNRLTETIEALERQSGQVAIALADAASIGDDETALVLITRRDELVAALDAKRREEAEVTQAIDQTTSGLQALREQIQQLKREREAALAQLASAEASIDIAEAASSVSTSAQARGLESVRSSVRVLEARAHEGYLDEEGQPVRGKAAALGRKAAEARARAELERLKRSRAGAPEADAPTGDDDDPEPRVKRTL